MTHKLVELAHDVRVLELEVRKLEYEKRVVQLKAEPTIETKETYRLHEIVLDMDATISDLMDNDRKINSFLDEYRVTVDHRNNTIEELKTENAELSATIDRMTNTQIARKLHIRNLNQKIEELKDTNIKNLKELSVRKEDSEVLCKICSIVNACLDAPEESPETSIDDLYKTTVSVFLEMP
jgi:predicted nuclease with TOPRIM domain